MFDGPKIEVHLSNIHQREPIYHRSLVSTTAHGVIAGMGALGYELAIEAVHNRLGAAAPRMTVLLTGGAGFLGAFVARRLLRPGMPCACWTGMRTARCWSPSSARRPRTWNPW